MMPAAGWRTELLTLVRSMFGNPVDDTHTIVLAAVAALSCLFAMRLLSRPFELGANDWWRILAVFVGTLGVVLAGVVALRAYLPQDDMGRGARIAAQAGTALLLLLAVGIPLQSGLQKGNYLTCLLTTFVSLIAAVLMTMLARGVWQAAESGAASIEQDRARQRSLEEGM